MLGLHLPVTPLVLRLSSSLLLVLGIYTQTFGQLSSYKASLYIYEDAVELFEKEKYGPAQRKIDAFLVFEDELRADEANDLRANARFIQAVSAYYLQRSETEALLSAFLVEFPENTKTPLASFYMGKYQLERRKYSAAIKPLLAAVQSSGLRQARFDEAIYLLAYSHLKNNEPANAISYFDILANRPNEYQEDAQYYAAVLHYEQGNFEAAYPALKALEKSKKYGDDTKIYLANTLLKLKRLDELYVMADQLMSRPSRKGESQIYYIVANASFEKEDYPRSTEFFNQYVQNRGKMTRPDYFRYGYSVYQQGDYDVAIPLFERAQRSTATDSLTQVASYYLGFCFLKTGKNDGAKLAFQKAARGGKNSVPEITQDALYQFSKVAFATESYAEALEALTEITQRYPRAPYISEVKALIGEVFLYTRNYPEAIRYFESTTLATTRARTAYQTVCYYYGLELIEQPDFGKALIYLKKSISNAVDANLSLSAQYWTGEAYYREGNLPVAKTAFQQFVNNRNARNNEFYPDGYYGLGWVAFKQKSYPTAISTFDRFLQLKGNENPPRMKVDANLRAGDAYFLQKKYSQAVNYYQNVMSLKYAYRDYATYQIAECYYRLGRYNQAVTQLDLLIRKGQKSEFRDDALDRISDIYATWLRDYPKALQYAKLLTQQYPKSPLAGAAYVRMAFAAIKLGKQSEAVSYYKKVLTDYGNDKDNAQAALDNLRSMVSAREFDRILRDYQNRYPDLDEGFGDIVFNTGKERFFEANYPSAIDQFSDYIKKYTGAAHISEAYLFRARSYRELNKIPEALADYAQVYNATVNSPFTFPALQEAAEINFER